MANSRTIQIKRIYDSPSADDGCRVLVDRLWPRGIKKQDAQIDFWAKQVAPTTELRQWFDHDPAKFDEFSSRYTRELASNSDAVEQIFDAAGDRAITLLYAARDTTYNHAIVLRDLLRIAL